MKLRAETKTTQATTRARRKRQRARNLETPAKTTVEVKEEGIAEIVTHLALREVMTATTIMRRTETRRMIAITLLGEEDEIVAETT